MSETLEVSYAVTVKCVYRGKHVAVIQRYANAKHTITHIATGRDISPCGEGGKREMIDLAKQVDKLETWNIWEACRQNLKIELNAIMEKQAQ